MFGKNNTAFLNSITGNNFRQFGVADFRFGSYFRQFGIAVFPFLVPVFCSRKHFRQFGTSNLKFSNRFSAKRKNKIDKIKGLRISRTSHFSKCNYWLNIIEIDKKLSKKDFLKIIQYLYNNGIEARPLWYPNHLQKKYKECQTYKLHNVKKIYQRRLCLPSSSQLTKKQQDFICQKLNNIF